MFIVQCLYFPNPPLLLYPELGTRRVQKRPEPNTNSKTGTDWKTTSRNMEQGKRRVCREKKRLKPPIRLKEDVDGFVRHHGNS